MNNFSIYQSKDRTGNFPEAANEHLIVIDFVDENGSSWNNVGKNFGTVYGYLSKEFEYEAVGNYTNVYDVHRSDKLLIKVLEDETQRNLANYGYLTKKMYTHGESPKVNVDFRCYAGDPNFSAGSKTNGEKLIDNHPVKIANMFINATLPRVTNNAMLNFTDLTKDNPLTKFISSFTKTFKGAGEYLANSFNGVQNQDQAITDSNSFTDFVSNIKLQDLVSKKPPLCNVKIGKIFEKDMMVVKSVNVKLSKEYLAPGCPLYADYSVSFDSLFNGSSIEDASPENERIFGSGLNSHNNTRVSFTVGSSDNNAALTSNSSNRVFTR